MTLIYPHPDLADGIVRLRRWRAIDVGCVRRAAADPRITESTTVPEQCTAAGAGAFIERQWRRAETGEGLSLVIADAASDEALGSLYLGVRPQVGVVGIGYWMAPGARGHGLSGRATRLATAWALREVGFARVEAWVEPDDVASQRLLTAAGFTREGVLRSYLSLGARRADAVVYSRIAQDSSRAER